MDPPCLSMCGKAYQSSKFKLLEEKKGHRFEVNAFVKLNKNNAKVCQRVLLHPIYSRPAYTDRTTNFKSVRCIASDPFDEEQVRLIRLKQVKTSPLKGANRINIHITNYSNHSYTVITPESVVVDKSIQ